MKKLFRACVTLLFIILVVTSTVLGILLYLKNTETLTLAADKANLDNRIKLLESQLSELQANNTDSTIKFEDTGLDIEIEYPNDWIAELNSKITNEYADEPVYGPIIQGYEFTLVKGDAELKFEKIMGAIDGFPSGLVNGTDSFEILGDDLVRVKGNGNSWRYVQRLDCSDFDDDGAIINLSDADECVSSFLGGFGNNRFASIANITATDENLIKEADEIVKSTLN